MQWWQWCIGPALLGLLFAFAIWDAKREQKREAFVLEHLLGFDDAYGLELVRASRGLLKRGTVYITLGRMEEEGLLASREETLEARKLAMGSLPRRLYRLTDEGRSRAIELLAEAA